MATLEKFGWNSKCSGKAIGVGIKRVFLLMSWLILLACAPRAATIPSVTEGTSSTPETAVKETWELQWDKLVAAAKKEGQVNLITSRGPELSKALGEGFNKRYGIRVESMTLRGAEVGERIRRERAAGLPFWDIFIGGSTTTDALYPTGAFDSIEPNLILPEVRNPAAYWNGELPLASYGTAISLVKSPWVPIIINTDWVKPEELESYKGLLNPKWKGKLVMDDPTTAGAAHAWANYIYLQNIAGGAAFLRTLVKQEPLITRDRRLLMEWVARGKYPIGLNFNFEQSMIFIQMGAPLKYITPIEGTHITHGGGAAGLINKQLHPNAARVFLNWLLTKEAGEIYAPNHGAQSSRVDVPTEFLNPDMVRKPGVKYFDSNREEYVEKVPEAEKEIKNIFAPLLK